MPMRSHGHGTCLVCEKRYVLKKDGAPQPHGGGRGEAACRGCQCPSREAAVRELSEMIATASRRKINEVMTTLRALLDNQRAQKLYDDAEALID